MSYAYITGPQGTDTETYMQPGRSIAGQAIGIMVLDVSYPLIPGWLRATWVSRCLDKNYHGRQDYEKGGLHSSFSLISSSIIFSGGNSRPAQMS